MAKSYLLSQHKLVDYKHSCANTLVNGRLPSLGPYRPAGTAYTIGFTAPTIFRSYRRSPLATSSTRITLSKVYGEPFPVEKAVELELELEADDAPLLA